MLLTCTQSQIVVHVELDFVLFGDLFPQLEEIALVHLSSFDTINMERDNDGKVENVDICFDRNLQIRISVCKTSFNFKNESTTGLDG